MRTSTLLSLLVAGSAVDARALLQPNFNETQILEIKNAHQKRQALGYLTTLIGKGGKVAAPLAAAGISNKQLMKSPSLVPGARRVKMRYGPYSVPSMDTGGISGEKGSLWNYPDTGIDKPCSECTIVAQQAGLEFPDGSNANIDSGMWLHHMVHFLKGPGRWDPTCYGVPSLPHGDVGASPMNSERYFSSGNERTFFGMDHQGAATKAGYHIKSTDSMAFIVDLMNMNMAFKTVYMTMTYDIVDGALPSGWRDVKTVWFDAAQCMTSEVNPPKQDGAFTVTSGSWTPNFDGEVLGMGGHLHDGGTNIRIMVNDKVNCDSVAKYSEKPEYVFKQMSMGGGPNMAKDHISSMSACYFEEIPIRRLSKAQSWKILGDYDYGKWPGNKDGGARNAQSSIMSISLMFVALDPK